MKCKKCTLKLKEIDVVEVNLIISDNIRRINKHCAKCGHMICYKIDFNAA